MLSVDAKSMARQLLPEVRIQDCTCDYCDGYGCAAIYAQPEGPLPPPFIGPITASEAWSRELNDAFKRFSADLSKRLYRAEAPIWGRIKRAPRYVK